MRRHNAFGRTSYANHDDDDDDDDDEFVHPFAQRAVPPSAAHHIPVPPSGSSATTSRPRRSMLEQLRIKHGLDPVTGRVREIQRTPDGSVSAYEQIIEPEDVRASSEARTDMINAYHDWDRDLQRMEMKTQRRQQKHEELMSEHQLYTDPNFLNHQLQMEQEKNRHEMEMMKAKQEADIETEKWFSKVDRALDNAKKAKEDKRFGRTEDIFAQLLTELSITPDQLRGCGYYKGFCHSRSTLVRNYLYTILFYGVDRVIRSNKEGEIIAYYTSKPPEKIKIKKEGMSGYPKINFIPERRMCIVDVYGNPIQQKTLLQKITGGFF